MRMILCSTILCAVLSSAAALAEEVVLEEDTLLGYVLEACESDIESFCDRVTPGDGRVAMCLAAYEDQISTDCTMALYDAAAIIDAITEELVYLAESCEADIDTFCADTVPGEGRILECLSAQADGLSEDCDDALEDIAEGDLD